jgi:protein gp37
MSDLFHERVPFEYVDQVFDIMTRARHHIFQVLTKRPDRLLAWHEARGKDALPSHVWLGVSVELQEYLWRVDRLRQVNVAVRFISAEPLLGPLTGLNLSGISWVITGGESGGSPARALVARVSGAWRPKREAVEWVREIRELCAVARIAFFHKQWGGPTPKAGGRRLDRRVHNAYPQADPETVATA